MEKNEILIIYGEDPAAMAYRIAEETGLDSLIGDTKKRVGLKPNLVVARRASGGATTHPEIAEGLIRYLQERGFRKLVILEGSWVGDRTREAFKVCGYRELAEKYGVELIDTQTDSSRAYDCKGIKIEICDSAMDLDFMINLPVMKGHCQTSVTCALKNNKGIIPDKEKRRFHSMGLHKPIAHLNTAAKNDFILVDGICGDLDFEEGGNPVYAGRLFAGRDPVLIDAWAAAQMGYETGDVPYIEMAEALGVGCADISKARVRELNGGSGGAGAAKASGKVKELSAYINENNACSACYASLIFALSRLSRNELGRITEPLCIGQGFRGKSGKLGIGNCCSGFKQHVPGCPPDGAHIVSFLKDHL
ncbi:DUF362 domain-containing protein [Treponema sp. OttesenSCG-928-L16]|nr:DUF362 domain-containing protein [Treponema sp. OttesenSCG-928-L16]